MLPKYFSKSILLWDSVNVFHLYIVPNIAHNPKQKTLIEKHKKTQIAKYFLKGS